MKILIVLAIVFGNLLMRPTAAQPVPAGQYCPVVSDFDIRPDVLYAGDYIAYYQRLPGGYTAERGFFIDKEARVINLVGRAYSIGIGIPPANPLPGGFGPVTPGPYRLVVEFQYSPAPSVQTLCPRLEIPFTVGGSGTGAAATPVPTLNWWMLTVLAGLLCAFGTLAQRHLRTKGAAAK